MKCTRFSMGLSKLEQAKSYNQDVVQIVLFSNFETSIRGGVKKISTVESNICRVSFDNYGRDEIKRHRNEQIRQKLKML